MSEGKVQRFHESERVSCGGFRDEGGGFVRISLGFVCLTERKGREREESFGVLGVKFSKIIGNNKE